MIFFKLLWAIALIEAGGALALRWLTRKQRPLRKLEFLGLAFGLGIGVISLGMFCLAFGRVRLDTWTVSLFLCGLFASLMALNIKGRRKVPLKKMRLEGGSRCPSGDLKSSVETTNRRSESGSHLPKMPSLGRLEMAMTAMICASCLLVAVDALSQPLLGFDARAIWGMKAKIIFSNHQIYGEDFLDPDRLHAKQRYPLGIPLALSFIYHSTGQLNDRFGKVIFPAFFLALLCFFYGALRRLFNHRYSLLGTCLLTTLPCFTIYANGGAASGYSDVPLTYSYTVFALSLFLWTLQQHKIDFVLALLFGIFALFTKNEGLALWGITLTCVVLFQSRDPEPVPKLAKLSLLAVASVAALLPWHLYRLQLPLLEEDYFQLLTLPNLIAGTDRLPYLAKSFLREFALRPHLWSLLGPCLTLAFLVSPRRATGRTHGVFMWIALLYCLFVVMIYLVIPWEMDELIPVSLTRLLMPLSPVLLFWMLIQTKETQLLPASWTGPGPE